MTFLVAGATKINLKNLETQLRLNELMQVKSEGINYIVVEDLNL